MPTTRRASRRREDPVEEISKQLRILINEQLEALQKGVRAATNSRQDGSFLSATPPTIGAVFLFALGLGLARSFIVSAINPEITGCSTNCTLTSQVCNISTLTCVDCLVDDDCSDGICDVMNNNTCVGCLEDTDCPTESPTCLLPNKTCIECLGNDECVEDTPICSENNRCVECTEDTNCNDGLYCSENKCIQCNKDSDCFDETPFCNLDSNTCKVCVTDENCNDDKYCKDETICVECANDEHCGGTTPHCSVSGICKECIDHTHCAGIQSCESGVCRQ